MAKTPNLTISSSDYFEALFHNTVQNTVLLMDENGIIQSVNKAFTNCFGYEPKDITGKPSAVLFTEEDQQRGLPEKELNVVLDKGQGADNNYLVTKNKTVIWVSGESILVQNKEGKKSILKIIQNIHQQKRSEISIQRLNDFSENILSSIEDVVIVLDEKLNILKNNRAFLNLFGLNNSDAGTINFAELIAPFDAFGHLKSKVQTAIDTQTTFSNTAVEIETASGEKRIFDVSCSPMHMNDENKVLLVIHDITVHKLVEREREDVIGFVAHELRNPLANLVLCNDILGDAIKENNQEEMLDMLARIKNNISRLNKMIAELYDATRVNAGHLKLDVSTFNFENMVKEAIETIEVLQPSYNIVIKGNGNIDISGDRYRLIQVITNYLSNGIKYSNGKTDVVLTIYHDTKSVTVSVKDEGLGISKQQLPYIFERFFRAEKTKNLEGIGLGLYLCRQIISAHNGQVWAESEEGKGSVFYFSVPLI